jgi:uncharacterized protein YjbJ (UPF0337 family)
MNVRCQTLLDLHQCQSGGRSYGLGHAEGWRAAFNSEDEIMDKDRVVGSAKQVKGAVKQAVGKAIGDAKLESEGNADKVEGKVQNVIGGLKDTLKGK